MYVCGDNFEKVFKKTSIVNCDPYLKTLFCITGKLSLQKIRIRWRVGAGKSRKFCESQKDGFFTIIVVDIDFLAFCLCLLLFILNFVFLFKWFRFYVNDKRLTFKYFDVFVLVFSFLLSFQLGTDKLVTDSQHIFEIPKDFKI